jgi:hypothetical protein
VKALSWFLILIVACANVDTGKSTDYAKQDLAKEEARAETPKQPEKEETKKEELRAVKEIPKQPDKVDTAQSIPEPLYPHTILVIPTKTDIAQEDVNTMVTHIANALRDQPKYTVFYEEDLKQKLYREMADVGIDPIMDGEKYLRQRFIQGNLLLYVSLTQRTLQRTSMLGVIKEVIVAVAVQDLITGQRVATEKASEKILGGGAETAQIAAAIPELFENIKISLLRRIAQTHGPDQNLHKVIAHVADNEKREKLNGVFRKLEKKELIQFEQIPFVSGGNFCLLFRYKGEKAKFIDLLQEYLKELHMNVEPQGYAVVITPKQEEQF